jgi:hypothetical protein
LREYGTRLRGPQGFRVLHSRTDGREVKILPRRALKANPEEDGHIKDWKRMFRISTNWRTGELLSYSGSVNDTRPELLSGRCTAEQLVDPIDPPEQWEQQRLVESHEHEGLIRPNHTHILLSAALVITASAMLSVCPIITLHHPFLPPSTLPCPARQGIPTQISALALDQSPPSHGHTLSLASFLCTGEFSIFSIEHNFPSSSRRRRTWQPQAHAPFPTIQAVYHHPVLMSLSTTYTLSVFHLSSTSSFVEEAPGDGITRTHVLKTFTYFQPTSLVLSNPTPGMYKLVHAHVVPVYPSHWTVGATELVFALTAGTVENMRIVYIGSAARAAEVMPNGPSADEQRQNAIRAQWARKVSSVADAQTDGKWIVLAPGHRPPRQSRPRGSTFVSTHNSPTALQLYRLVLPPITADAHKLRNARPKLVFVRALHGHTGPVSAVSLADGRCVSLGVDGSIWVWDLEEGRGALVATGAGGEGGGGGTPWPGWAAMPEGSVVFDERRIASASIDAHAGRVNVCTFDI